MPSLKVAPTTDRNDRPRSDVWLVCSVPKQIWSLPIQMQKVKGHLVQKF